MTETLRAVNCKERENKLNMWMWRAFGAGLFIWKYLYPCCSLNHQMICIFCGWNSSSSHHLIIIIVFRAKHSIPLFLISVLLALINWSCSPVVPRIRQTPIFGHNTTHAILEHLWLLIIIFHIFGDNLVANKIGQGGRAYQFLNGIWQKSIK